VNKAITAAFAFAVTLTGTGCSPSSDDANPEGYSSGGAISGGSAAISGGGTASSGGAAVTGGAPSSSGGITGAGASSSAGGASSEGGAPAAGGMPSTGGAFATGGVPATGGASGTGGSPTGGASGTGGASTTGGTSGTGGSTGGETCALPRSFKWTSGGPIASPKNGWVSIKDFSHVFYEGKHVVYMTTHDQSNWGSAMMTFTDWPDAAAAPQTKTASGVAPTLFFFTPKQIWVLAYQWGPHKFSYKTAADPTNATAWSAEKSLYNTALPNGGTGPIDQTVICNSTKCFLYYAGDNGHIYKSSMPIANFPGEFPGAQDSGIQGTTQNLFEAVQVYAVKGSNEYLMIVEAQGSARYFRAFTATDLDGPWTLLTDSFANKSNVTFSTSWTNDVSHGDLVRTNPDETFTVDPCNLQLVFQGRDPNFRGDYGLIPYKLGLLTLAK
jgi:hypothetical protein